MNTKTRLIEYHVWSNLAWERHLQGKTVGSHLFPWTTVYTFIAFREMKEGRIITVMHRGSHNRITFEPLKDSVGLQPVAL